MYEHHQLKFSIILIEGIVIENSRIFVFALCTYILLLPTSFNNAKYRFTKIPFRSPYDIMSYTLNIIIFALRSKEIY